MDTVRISSKPASGTGSVPEAEPLSEDKPKDAGKDPDALSLFAECVVISFGNSLPERLSQRAVRIMSGELCTGEDPTDLPPLPGEENPTEETAAEEEKAEEGEEEEDVIAPPIPHAALREELPDELPAEDAFDFLSADISYEPSDIPDEPEAEAPVAADGKTMSWMEKFFADCRKDPCGTDGEQILRAAGKISHALGFGVRIAEVDVSSGGEPTEPDALPALFLSAAASLFGTEEPVVTLSFFYRDGEPRMRLRMTSEKGTADTAFFDGVRHYAETTGVYFATAPLRRGFLVEICVARVELSVLGLKNPDGFSFSDRFRALE